MNRITDLFDQDSYRPPAVEAALSCLAEQDESGRGAVFTRPEIVDSILDLCGYVEDQPLHLKRALEPSFGAGDFLLPIVQRLLASFTRSGGTPERALVELGTAVKAVELHRGSFDVTFARVASLLRNFGLSVGDANALCERWLICDDFLLSPIEGTFDFVMGNPPYLRQERIPAALLIEYRRRFQTLYDRADLYIPFFERALDLLGEHGVLGYICANRWLKNRYGGPLREKIWNGYWLKFFIDLEGANAFHTDVIAYPAITILQRLADGEQTAPPTRAVGGRETASLPVSLLTAALLGSTDGRDLVEQIELRGHGSAPLLLDDIPRLVLLRRIEQKYPTLEQAGCRVGIGVATGCDRVYIRNLDELPIEAERRLPLVMASDLVDGELRWLGKGMVNPYDEAGKLVSLDNYPRMRRYLLQNREAVAARNVAKRSGDAWFRTIDRVQPGLLNTPKLLVPDIKGEGVFVLDQGHYYPHHNLYYITSDNWDLRALRTILRSSLTLMTVATYCTRMSGGYLRFQAQYLRRIRVPAWSEVSTTMRNKLIASTNDDSQRDIDAIVFDLYQLSPAEARHTAAVADAARIGKTSTS